jgi:hypothetical protein
MSYDLSVAHTRQVKRLQTGVTRHFRSHHRSDHSHPAPHPQVLPLGGSALVKVSAGSVPSVGRVQPALDRRA